MIQPGLNTNIVKSIKISGNNIVPYFIDLAVYMEKNGVKLSPMPKLTVSLDTQYQHNPFGKTAYYNPYKKSITLYTAGRHIKDILRSFAHELIHHSQNITGMFDPNQAVDLGNPRYAEENDHLKKMEEDAYLRGNMLFRAWEDQYK
jgi:hypothetical protein